MARLADDLTKATVPIPKFIKSLCWWLIVAALCLVSAEIMCRLDDWVRFDMSPLSSPTDATLTISDAHGKHGRPHARFKKWRLNSQGFRGAEIDEKPTPGRRRVLILGASESFGLYESANQEFPAQLQRALQEQHEVINAAFPGMSLPRMIEYWKRRTQRLRPEIVLIYPSPQFYLNTPPPALDSPTIDPPAAEPHGESFRSRYVDRMRDLVQYPDAIQRWRVARLVASIERQHPPDWLFRGVPPERLESFIEHIDSLVRTIHASGATPILITHATVVSNPPTSEDLAILESARKFFTQASATTIDEFNRQANERLRAYAMDNNIDWIDADLHLSGTKEYFGDLVHFTDQGSAAMAELLAEHLRRLAVRAAQEDRHAVQ